MRRRKPFLNDTILKTFKVKQKYMQKEYWKKEFQYNGEKLKKQKYSKVMCSLDIWGEKDLHTNPKV